MSGNDTAAGDRAAGDSVRLDVWLDVACLYKTRSEAKRACQGGKVDINGARATPHRLVHEGDRLRLSRGFGRQQEIVVRLVISQHVKKSESTGLYDDVTPKPTPEEIEMRRLERTYRAAAQAAGAPDRRRRREIRRFKQGE